MVHYEIKALKNNKVTTLGLKSIFVFVTERCARQNIFCICIMQFNLLANESDCKLSRLIVLYEIPMVFNVICSYFAFNHNIKYISGKTHPSISY